MNGVRCNNAQKSYEWCCEKNPESDRIGNCSANIQKKAEKRTLSVVLIYLKLAQFLRKHLKNK